MFVDKVFLFNSKMYGKYNIYTFCLFCHFMYKCSNSFQEGLAGNSSKNTEGTKCDESSDDKLGSKILKEKQKENYQNNLFHCYINIFSTLSTLPIKRANLSKTFVWRTSCIINNAV